MCTWGDSLIRDMPHSFYVSSTSGTTHHDVFSCDMTRSHVICHIHIQHDLFTCDIDHSLCVSFTCDMTHSRVTWRIHTHLHVRHDTCRCETWLIRIWHDSSTRVQYYSLYVLATWDMMHSRDITHMCDTMHVLFWKIGSAPHAYIRKNHYHKCVR